jgi:hypothetical protein
MILLAIKGALTCHADALRVTGNGYRSELVLISMFGPRNAVRAAWATLSVVGRRGRRESIQVGDTYIAKSERASYTTVNPPLERGLLHCVIFHQQLGHNAPDLGYVYQTGPDAERRYFDRLARWCPVPLRAAWREPLWDIGRARGAITEVTGHGREVWHVATKREVWEPIVRDALVAGELR